MGRIITAVALSGWLAILAIAYRLADNRIDVACGTIHDLQDGGCVARMQAQRDSILTIGLTGALAIVVVSLIIYSARRRERPVEPKSGWSPANRGQQARLR